MEKLVNNGGDRIANEIGKFKFLNNFIRILSPKYQGEQTSQQTQQMAIRLLYCWKESLRHLNKIREVYDLLVKQNVIEATFSLEPEEMRRLCCHFQEDGSQSTTHRQQNRLASFEDEEKSKLLAELLKSKKAEDLQAANRMIKSMVRAVSLKKFF